MAEALEPREVKGLLVFPGKWEIQYEYAAGKVLSEFFRRLKEGVIVGARCPSCRRVLMPPRQFCERCMVEIEELVNVKDEGELLNFIIVYRKFYGLPDPPYAVGVIRLDGADEPILHFLGGVDVSSPHRALRVLKPGIRVKAVWREDRRGSILDIRYFKPVGEKGEPLQGSSVRL